MRRVATGCFVALAATLAVAGGAAADTLPSRDGPFTPAQAPADQYTTPSPIAPIETTPPTAQPADGREEGPRGAPGGSGDEPGGGAAPTAQGPRPADVDGAAAAPPEASGTLPFTGGDLLALVWIALALLAAGAAAEILRRRIEARRA